VVLSSDEEAFGGWKNVTAASVSHQELHPAWPGRQAAPADMRGLASLHLQDIVFQANPQAHEGRPASFKVRTPPGLNPSSFKA
jgi:hypothetical protein